MDNQVFVLLNAFEDMDAGTLLLKSPDTSEDGQEFFDMTTEMNTGNCYSHYNVPAEFMMPAAETQVKIVTDFLDNLKD